MNVDRYVTDNDLMALWATMRGAETLGHARGAIRAVLPGILAAHRADVVADVHAELAGWLSTQYRGGRDTRAPRVLQRLDVMVRIEREKADRTVADV